MSVDQDYEPSPIGWVRDQVELYESSGGTEGTTLRDTGYPVVVLTLRGAKSGKVRKTPLMRVEHAGVYAAVASQGGAPKHPVWYHNMVAHPPIGRRGGPVKRPYVAGGAGGGEKEIWWERAVARSPPYADYQRRTDRQIPLLLLEPVD